MPFITENEKPGIPQCAIDFFGLVRNKSVVSCFTWITHPSALKDRMNNPNTPPEERDLLRQCLHDKPVGEFVTLHFVLQLFGIKFCRFENSIQKCPREAEVEDLVEPLIPLLQALDTNAENVDAQYAESRQMVDRIRGDNYSSYKRPPAPKLARFAMQLLKVIMKEIPTSHVIHIERVTVHALQAFESDWFE